MSMSSEGLHPESWLVAAGRPSQIGAPLNVPLVPASTFLLGDRLEYIDLATRLEDLKVPPGNRLHALERERKGQHSISVNDQWRICFRFEDGDAYEVEITDYH